MPPGSFCRTCEPERLASIDRILIFSVVELVAFVLLLRSRLVTNPIYAAACATLFVLMFLQGPTVDLVCRGSMGPLFVMALGATERLLTPQQSPSRWLAVALALAICLPTSASEIVYHATNGTAHRNIEDKSDEKRRWVYIFSQDSSMGAKEFFDICGWKYEQQYFATQRPMVVKEGSLAPQAEN